MLAGFADAVRVRKARPRSRSRRPGLGDESTGTAAPAHWRRAAERGARDSPDTWHTLDPACEIPARPTCSPRRTHRPQAVYLLRRGDRGAHPRRRDHRRALPAATMQALISLIAATGLRVGEAWPSTAATTGLDNGTLTVTGKGTIRCAWCHCTRPPLRCSRGYATRRDRLCPHLASPAVFVTSTGQRSRTARRGIQETFARLVALAEHRGAARDGADQGSTTSGTPSPSPP